MLLTGHIAFDEALSVTLVNNIYVTRRGKR